MVAKMGYNRPFFMLEAFIVPLHIYMIINFNQPHLRTHNSYILTLNDQYCTPSADEYSGSIASSGIQTTDRTIY